MRIKPLIIILSLVLQSCSVGFNEWGRTPASSEANFDDLITQMKSFKTRVMGTQKDAVCSKEQQDRDFNMLMKSIKRDSCSEQNYAIDRAEFDKAACPKIKVEGYFDKLVKTTIAEEKAKKKLSYFQSKIDPQFIKINKEAQSYLTTLGTIIHNEKYPAEDRAALIAEYIENVAHPIRSVIVVMRSYLPKEDDGRIFYEALQPYVTPVFIKGLDERQLALITQGPNASSDPFYMDIKEQNNGTYRIVFSETDVIRRDVITLLKAPTAKNYVMALKWMTLHMMLSQVHLYETLLGNKGVLNIPNSCQTHFNGNLPKTMKFASQDGVGDIFLENILGSHGLTIKDGDDEESELARTAYFDYFMENVSKDPTKEGYSGLVPFENYKNALRSTDKPGVKALDPQFDDVAHFKSILQFKKGEAENVFRKKIKGVNVNIAGHEVFKQMLGEFSSNDIAKIKISDTEETEIYPGKQNLSPYMLKVMQDNGLTDYSELITERMKKKFVGKQALIDFPSLYSSPVWRQWSLRVLADAFYDARNLPETSKLGVILRNACSTGSRRTGQVEKLCQGNRLMNMSNLLSEFRKGDRYIPSKRLETEKFDEVYPLLAFLWVNMRDVLNIIPDAKPYELNFLLDQMNAGNPWARLKFSYMVALDQFEHQQEGLYPKYDRKNPFTKKNDGLRCKINNVYVQYNAIKMAGAVLGLDRPLTFNHAEKFLNHKEKVKLWGDIVQDINQGNAQLFSVKSGNQNFYKIMENVSYKTLLDEKSALSTGVRIQNSTVGQIKTISNSVESQLSNFYLSLYKFRADFGQQFSLYEKFSKNNGIDSAYSVKMNFIAVDNSYKKVIYKDLLRQAAHARKLQVLSKLESFCKMDINDQASFKNIFYSSSKAQNDLNQLAGLPGIPEDVLSKVNEMTDSEWRDMWWGIGSGVAGMAAIIVGGACTTFTGGICAPLGAAMVIAGTSALGIQVKLTSNELDRKIEADESEKQVKLMEDLGFADSGSSDEVHRSYAWAAFEAISIFPLIGIATRSALLGPKLAYVSGRSIMQKTGKTAFKARAKSAVQEEETRAAQFLLGFDGGGKSVGVSASAINEARDKVSKIGMLYKSGDIDMQTMINKISAVLAPFKRAKIIAARTVRNELGHVTIKTTPKAIDAKVAKITADYFSDNPKNMLRFIEGYSGDKLARAIKTMDELNAAVRIGRRIPVYSGAKDWMLRMRNESLAKNAAKILRIEKELKALGNKPGQLQAYINKNMEDLTEIMIDLPFKKREIPYFVFVQGMPEFNFFKGRRIPVLNNLSQGQTLRRVFLARARLIEETYKVNARAVLKIKRFAHTDTTFDVFKAFQLSIAELANSKSASEALKVVNDYRKMEDAIARKLFSKFTKKNSDQYRSFQEMIVGKSAKQDKEVLEAFKEMVFNPKTLKEKGQAEAIWESVPADELMGMKEVGEFAHRAAQELSKQYNDVDSYERLLSAFKVLVINRNSAVLEVM